MKETSGELSMTVIVIVAAVAIITLLTTVLLPNMGNTINKKWNNMIGMIETDTLVSELR